MRSSTLWSETNAASQTIFRKLAAPSLKIQRFNGSDLVDIEAGFFHFTNLLLDLGQKTRAPCFAGVAIR